MKLRIRHVAMVLSLGAVVVASGCSTAQVRVMPGSDGVNRVVSRDIERDDAEEAAVEAANEYCANRKLQAVFLKDETKYTGQMDENTRNTIRNGSAIAMVLGSSTMGTAGQVGYGMTSDRDYKSEVVFKCK